MAWRLCRQKVSQPAEPARQGAEAEPLHQYIQARHLAISPTELSNALQLVKQHEDPYSKSR
jgi:hypothetical protein